MQRLAEAGYCLLVSGSSRTRVDVPERFVSPAAVCKTGSFYQTVEFGGGRYLRWLDFKILTVSRP